MIKTKLQIITALLLMPFFTLAVNAKDIHVKDFGAVGDGTTDDGKAIQEALKDLGTLSGKHTLIFGSEKQYYIKKIKETFLFELHNQSDITIEGNGSTFLLDGAVRLIDMKDSKNITFKNFNVDYKPLPFVEGKMIAINQAENYIDVLIDEYFDMPPMGGATNENGEQSYFGLAWYQGRNALLATHFYFTDMYKLGSTEDDRSVRLDAKNFKHWNDISVGGTISLPVRGNAHIGGNAVVELLENTDIKLENINVWTAPWFAFRIVRNSGEMIFRNVNVMPKTGTNRILSSWRDGFHVKSNYARLLFEDCHLEGLGDDAFNTATFMSSVKNVASDKEIQIKQNYPLQIVPYNEGDIVVVYDIVAGKILGRRKVVSSSGFVQTGTVPAPQITLVLDNAIAGMSQSCVIWNESSANPNTVLKNCTIYQSNRFQSSITIDHCDITAFSWFYGINIEGPLPSNIVVKNSKLSAGRGNPSLAASFSVSLKHNGTYYKPTEAPVGNILLQNNIIDANMNLNYCQNVSVINNKFSATAPKIQVERSKHILFQNNSIGETPINSKSQLVFRDDESKENTIIEVLEDKTEVDIIQPFSHWQGYTNHNAVWRYHSLPDAIKPIFISDTTIQNNQTDCYKIILPESENTIKKVSLEVFPQSESETISFWSYLSKGASGNITAIVKNAEGKETEIYSIKLNSSKFQNHQIDIPADYNANEQTLEIYFKALDGKAKQPLYIGQSDIEIPTSIDAHGSLSPSFFNIINKTAGSLELAVAKTGGELLVYDSIGREVFSKHNIKEKTTIEREELASNGLMIFLYTVDGTFYRKKGMFY